MAKLLKSMLTFIIGVILVIAILMVYEHLYSEGAVGKLGAALKANLEEALKESEELEKWEALQRDYQQPQ